MHFFNTYLWFNVFLKLIMCITYHFLSCKLAKSFVAIAIFISSDKIGKSFWKSHIFSEIWILTSKKLLADFCKDIY